MSKSFQPYQVQHIFFEKWNGVILQQTPAYIVFWYRQIPLGNAWLDHPLPEASVFQIMIDSISPAMSYYQALNDQPRDWKQTLVAGDSKGWQQYLESLFMDQIATEIPSLVPLSVVICTRNRAGMLHACLSTLKNLQCRPQEVIVVDNAPEDDQTKKAVAEFPGVIYCVETRPGLDYARNAGIKKASLGVVAFIDDDVTVHPHWALQTFNAFNEPGVQAMAGLVLPMELETGAQIIFEKYWSFNRGYVPKMYSRKFIDDHLTAGPPVWQIGAGANMAFRKEALQKIGLFDVRLDAGAAGCNGDSELWFRLLAADMKISYNPLAVVQHRHRRESKALKSQIFYYMRGFTVAALIQHNQLGSGGYRKHVFRHLPKYYLLMVRKGFPFYRDNFSTLWQEIRGWWNGRRYYKKNCR